MSPQATNHSDEPHQPLLTLRPWLRGLISLFLVALAVCHLLWPDIPIDAVFLGLLAFAGLLWFFDVDSIEWQGIRARRRQIAKARAALKEEPPSRGVMAPVVPEVPKPLTVPPSPSPPVTVHAQPTDLNPPVDKLDRLLWGAEQIRIELIVLLGNAGGLKRVAPWSDFSLTELLRLAANTKFLGGSTADAILTVANMRNLAVHSQILDPAADLAMDVVLSLRAVPRDYTRIRYHHISVFKDRSLSSHHDTHAVMTVQVNEDGDVLTTKVFPRDSEFATGRFTSWNWNLERVFRQEAWYADPKTQEPKLAWSEAATFAGREYPEQWGLQYRLPQPDLGIER